jgi:hypothetical protein
MQTLSRCPSKQEEIDHYRAFVESLPRASYLADILAGTVEPVEQQIRSDLAMPDTLPTLWQARRDEADRLEEVRGQVRAAESQLARIQLTIDRAEGALADLRTAAARIAATR